MKSGGRHVVMVVVTALAAVALTSCGVFTNQAERGAAAMLRDFAVAMRDQDVDRAADLTTSPAQAKEVLAKTLDNMNPDSVKMTVDDPVQYSDGTASFRLTTVWGLGKDKEWVNVTDGQARQLSVGWRIQWSPEILAKGLAPGGSLTAVRTDARPAPTVKDTNGKDLLVAAPLNEIALVPARIKNLASTTRQVASMIKPVAPAITAAAMTKMVKQSVAKNGRAAPVTVVSLRDSDFQMVSGDPDKLTGVVVSKRTQLVTADRRMSSPLFTGLTDFWQAIRDATAGWAVQLTQPRGRPQKIAGEQGPAGTNVNTTINPSVQLDANDSVSVVGQSATMIVLDSRNGAILGSAQNDYAVGSTALTEQYTPGDTLDPVLDAINRADQDAKTDAVTLNHLGLGLTFTIPGIRPVTSSLGDNQGGVDKSAPLSSGSMKVSPLSMAAMGMAVARGNSIAPYVVDHQPGRVDGKAGAGQLGEVDPGILAAIRAAMKRTATSGDASDLKGARGLSALVGTNGPQGPGWFVGISGNRVVVIYCQGERSGSAALAVAQRYFRSSSNSQ